MRHCSLHGLASGGLVIMMTSNPSQSKYWPCAADLRGLWGDRDLLLAERQVFRGVALQRLRPVPHQVGPVVH